MRSAQIAVLAIALLAGGTAAFMITRNPEPAAATIVEKPVAVQTVDVLVAQGELTVGQTVRADNLRWQHWPIDIVPTGSITRATQAGALEESVGSIVRYSFLAGEPIRKEKLIKSDGSGFMSAILGTGKRAIAISIDTRGATSAGGFILPNDHVDVLRTYRDEDSTRAGGADVQAAETLLSNIRVLAIGQNVQERNGEKVVTGETATLEVTPQQAEVLALAQKVGQLALVLRSLADANVVDAPVESREEAGLTVIRYGIKQTIKR